MYCVYGANIHYFSGGDGSMWNSQHSLWGLFPSGFLAFSSHNPLHICSFWFQFCTLLLWIIFIYYRYLFGYRLFAEWIKMGLKLEAEKVKRLPLTSLHCLSLPMEQKFSSFNHWQSSSWSDLIYQASYNGLRLPQWLLTPLGQFYNIGPLCHIFCTHIIYSKYTLYYIISHCM
jgi:hypothetical protein